MSRVAFFIVSAGALGLCAFAACDSDTVPLYAVTDGGPGGGDGAPATEASTIPAGDAQQTGKIVDFSQQGTGVAATITGLGTTTQMTDAKGNYAINYPLNQNVTMMVTAPNYYRLIEGEWLLKASTSRGTTRLLSNDTANALLMTLQLAGPLDKTLGILSVWAIPKTGCMSEAGATFTANPSGPTTKLVYSKSGFPSPGQDSAVAGENPHAVFYNLPIGEVTVTVSHPSCSQLPYPQDDDMGFTYSGKVQVAGDGTTVSFLRVFLGPLVTPDAGPPVDAGGDDSGDASDDADQ